MTRYKQAQTRLPTSNGANHDESGHLDCFKPQNGTSAPPISPEQDISTTIGQISIK